MLVISPYNPPSISNTHSPNKLLTKFPLVLDHQGDRDKHKPPSCTQGPKNLLKYKIVCDNAKWVIHIGVLYLKYLRPETDYFLIYPSSILQNYI